MPEPATGCVILRPPPAPPHSSPPAAVQSQAAPPPAEPASSSSPPTPPAPSNRLPYRRSLPRPGTSSDGPVRSVPSAHTAAAPRPPPADTPAAPTYDPQSPR